MIIKVFLLSLIIHFVAANQKRNLFCYHHRVKTDHFALTDINPTLCSHLIYDDDDFIIDNTAQFLQLKSDIYGPKELTILEKLNLLKMQYPHLKILLSIGKHQNRDKTIAGEFELILAEFGLRRKLLVTLVAFMKKANFDGLELALHIKHSMINNFPIMVKEFKTELNKHNLKLVVNVEAIPTTAHKLYNVTELVKYANYIVVDVTELRGLLHKQVGFDTPLYPPSIEVNDYEKLLNIQTITRYWLSQGVPANKLIIFVTTVGKVYNLYDADYAKPGDLADTVQLPKDKQNVYYNEICKLIVNDKWTVKWDSVQKVPYAHKHSQWMNYDNIKSVQLKTRFAIEMQLGGIAFGPLKYDDYRGDCGDGKFPLLNATYAILNLQQNQYQYYVNVKVTKRHIRKGYEHEIYSKEEQFDTEQQLFSILNS